MFLDGTVDPARAPRAAGPSAARDLNTARVVDVVRRDGPITQADLIRRSGLSRPTVGAIVRDLLHRQVVVEAGPDPSVRNGRPGSLLAFNPKCATVGVIRLLPKWMDLWIGDCEGRVLGHARRRSPATTSQRLDDLAGALTRSAVELDVPRPSSVAILLAGRADPVSGMCFGAALAARPVPLMELEQRLDTAVTVLNPTAAAALGVARTGRYADALVVFLDHGIGAGIVSGGRALTGGSGGAGELGHCRLPGVDRLCQCGARGCLETVAAGWFLRERAREIIGSRSRIPRTLAGLERLGHPELDGVLNSAARQLGLGASWLVNSLDPRVVLLGGTPFAAGAGRFLETFADSVREHSFRDRGRELIIDFAEQTADVDGAIQIALDRLALHRH
ncbi:ROK family transcriptional regulator [Microlunatus ginsengisoli]|uniref:ROK family transcriptional regulator n=1 Tax=Microlunatus ginsengisoli TaxID=363863 RepID=A0ABP6ZML1_9ACTN